MTLEDVYGLVGIAVPVQQTILLKVLQADCTGAVAEIMIFTDFPSILEGSETLDIHSCIPTFHSRRPLNVVLAPS